MGRKRPTVVAYGGSAADEAENEGVEPMRWPDTECGSQGSHDWDALYDVRENTKVRTTRHDGRPQIDQCLATGPSATELRDSTYRIAK